MPPESGGICGRLTEELPLGCLQGGVGRTEHGGASSSLLLSILELSDTQVYEP